MNASNTATQCLYYYCRCRRRHHHHHHHRRRRRRRHHHHHHHRPIISMSPICEIHLATVSANEQE